MLKCIDICKSLEAVESIKKCLCTSFIDLWLVAVPDEPQVLLVQSVTLRLELRTLRLELRGNSHETGEPCKQRKTWANIRRVTG